MWKESSPPPVVAQISPRILATYSVRSSIETDKAKKALCPTLNGICVVKLQIHQIVAQAAEVSPQDFIRLSLNAALEGFQD